MLFSEPSSKKKKKENSRQIVARAPGVAGTEAQSFAQSHKKKKKKKTPSCTTTHHRTNLSLPP